MIKQVGKEILNLGSKIYYIAGHGNFEMQINFLIPVIESYKECCKILHVVKTVKPLLLKKLSRKQIGGYNEKVCSVR